MLGRTIFAVVAVGSSAACGITGPAHTEPPPPDTAATVTMSFTRFSPGPVTIRTGQTVQWRNTSLVHHTVTADPGRAADPANVELPDGARPFHSGRINAGQVWSYRFTVPGTYRYVCLPHERDRMVGTVIVQA